MRGTLECGHRHAESGDHPRRHGVTDGVGRAEGRASRQGVTRVTVGTVMRHRFGIVVVRGASMTPTLRDGDRLLVRWGRAGARPGAVAVVRLPGGRPLAIKRLAFAEGAGWWVERDNPAAGVDSWQVGAIGSDDVLGIVLFRIAPSPGRVAKISQ